MTALIGHMARGDGPPLLLLNGGTMSMGAWEPVAAPLEARYRVIRCDYRGQLLSPGTPPPALSGHAADVVALLDALDLADVHLAGASYGGLVALTLAIEYPDRVRSLAALTTTDRVTADMWEGADRLKQAAEAAAAGGDGGVVFDLLVPATFSDAWREAQGPALAARRAALAGLPPAWFSGVAGLLAALRGVDLRPSLPRIACPTLIVAAERDRTFPVEHSRVLARGISGARLEVVPGAPHGMIVEDAERTARLIDDFVAEVERARRA